MSRLGFDKESGMIYEGIGGPGHPVWPTPIVVQATIIEDPTSFEKVPPNFDIAPFSWMFREDYYDPVSRVRRGRLFQKFGNAGLEYKKVEVHPALHSDIRRIEADRRVSKSLGIFSECTELLNKPNNGEGMSLVTGNASTFSVWRIIQTERTVNQDILVTLRSESSLGILPDLDVGKIGVESSESVKSAIARVLDTAYRELPTSIVDQCRNAVTVIVSRWMFQETGSVRQDKKDLGSWISSIRSHFNECPKIALCASLEVINKLHPRGKDNELKKLELQSVSEKDAELAVQIVGFVIREVGWAKS